ncbi:MAG: DUF86 domain-containing protein [Clostridiaceae bacterium]|nr:DUF86 domain-containing protein [Clostridiaceae bacterium]
MMISKKALNEIVKKYNIELLVYFGSYGTEFYNNESDIDIAFLSADHLSIQEKLELLEDLIHYHKKSEIDLVDLRTADPVLRHEIAVNGRVLYEKEKNLFERYGSFYKKAIYEQKSVLEDETGKITNPAEQVFDNAVICKKLEVLINYFDEFRQLTDGLTFDDYADNIVTKRAIEREIQLIVENATDINNMILKKMEKGPSRDYYNSFIDLAEINVIDMEFAVKIAPSAGLRNILVHGYKQVEDEIVYSSINNVKNLYMEYIDIMSKFLGCK